MKNLFTNLMKNTAKSSQNTGGGASQCQTSRSEGARQITARFESAQMKNTSLISGCSAVDVPMPSYGASDEHPMSTRSASDERRWNSRGWKYVACLLIAFFVGVGQMWGANQTYSISTPEQGAYTDATSGITVIGYYNSSAKIDNVNNKVFQVKKDAQPLYIASVKANIKGVSFDFCNNSSGSTQPTMSIYTANNAAFVVPTTGFSATIDGNTQSTLSGITVNNAQSTHQTFSITFTNAISMFYVYAAGSTNLINVRNLTVTYDDAITLPDLYATITPNGANSYSLVGSGEMTTKSVNGTSLTVNSVSCYKTGGSNTYTPEEDLVAGDIVVFTLGNSSDKVLGVKIPSNADAMLLTKIKANTFCPFVYVVPSTSSTITFQGNSGDSYFKDIKVYHTSSGGGEDPDPATTYSVTHTLTNNITASSGATGSSAATEGSAYNAVFAANKLGYSLPSTIGVTIGGEAATVGTDYTWNSSTGAFQVPAAKVTGNIVVTIAGVAPVKTFKSDYSDFTQVGTSNNYYAYLSQTNYTAYATVGWMVYEGESTGGTKLLINPETDEAISPSSNTTYGKIKQVDSKYMEFYVTGISSVKFYFHNGGSDERTAKYKLNGGDATDLVAVTNGTSNAASISLNSSTDNTIRVYASGDIYLCAMKVTVAPSCSAPTSPTITATPASAAYTVGDNISLTASATGTDGSTTYQWYKGDPANSGVSQGDASPDGATFSKASCVVADAGTYYCVISNGAGCEVTTYQAITVAKADMPSTGLATGTATSITTSGATLPFTMTSTSGVGSLTIKVYDDNDDVVITVTNITPAKSGSQAVTGLSAGTTYYYTITPIGDANHNDGSETSASSTFTTETVAYSVTYAANGGSGDVPTDDNTYSPNAEVTVLGKNTLSKSGYTFCGWSYNGYVYVEGDKFEITEDATLTAVWNQNATTVTITNFATSNTNTSNNIPDDNSKYFYGYKGTVSDANALTLTSNDGNDRGQNSGVEMRLTFNKKMRVYANNTTNAAPATFTGVTAISFKWMFIASGNSGKTELTSSYTVKVGSTTVANAVSITGKTTDGYATVNITGLANLNGYVEILFGGSSSAYNVYLDDIAITYSASTYKKVTFNKGSGPSTVSGLPADRYVPSGSKISRPATDPTATGYIFNGWVTESGGSTPFDFSGTISTDKTIYAKWTAKTAPTQYTVTIDAATVCSGSSTNIKMASSQSGVSYQLYKGEDKVGDAKAGGSALTWSSVSATGTYKVMAVENETYAAREMSNTVSLANYDAVSIKTDPTSEIAATVDVGSDMSVVLNTGTFNNATYTWQTCTDATPSSASDISSGSQYANYNTATMTFTPATEGTYYFRCKVTDDCGTTVYSNVATVTAEVAKADPEVYTVSGTTSVCEGDDATITLSGSEEGVTYALYKDAVDQSDNKVGDGNAITWTVTADGTYTVSAKADATYNAADMTGSAVISYKTATAIGTQPTTTVNNQHDGVDFTLGSDLAATGEGTLTYQWYSYTSAEGAGQATIGSATTTKTLTTSKAAGTYYYKVEVIGECGRVKSDMITVTVDNKHRITYDANNGSGAPSGNWKSPGAMTLPTDIPTRSGYIFLGWNTKDDGTGDMYQPDGSFTMPSSATTLYAAWASPCFTFSKGTKGTEPTDGFVMTPSNINSSAFTAGATLSGGNMINTSGATLGINGTHGFVMIKSTRELTITLTGGQFQEGTVIELEGTTHKASGSKTYGFSISGNALTSLKTVDNDNTAFSQRYVVTASDGVEGEESCTITMNSSATGSQTYLSAIKIGGCMACTSISPTLTYSKTTIWMDDESLTASPTLNKDGSTGSVTYVSGNTAVATINESTGVVTAVKRGTATITATIAADGTHCGKTATCDITVKSADCGYTEVAKLTRTSGSGSKGTISGPLAGDYGVYTQGNGKLGSDGYYMYLVLSSGHYYADGDSVYVTINTINDHGSYLTIRAGGKVPGADLAQLAKASLVVGANNGLRLSNVPANTDTITIYRKDGSDQNHQLDAITVKRYGCPDVYYFNDESKSGEWSDEENWLGPAGQAGGLPTIDDRVVINKPMTVDVTNAKAKEIILDQSSLNTGKLIITAGNALLIAETLAKTTDGETKVATEAADVIINSTRATGVGALIIGGETGTNAATMNFETKAKNDDGWVNQFVGSPFSNNTPYVDYALQLYKFVPQANGDRGWWQTHTSGTMTPFWGYNVLYNDNNYLDVTWTGTLNASESKMISDLYYNGSSETDNMFANSWTAPIHVEAIEDADLVNASKTLYMFNAGTPAQEEGNNGSNAANNNTEPGTYISIPIHSATYAGIGVIPSMQAFYVLATGSGASITLDYNKVVYTPALTSVGIVPNRAPRRSVAADEPEVIKLRVQSESGWAANTYVMGRADFAESYEDGWDGAYIEGESATPKLYTPSIDGNMFINCLPEIEGTVVGFRKGTEDNYYTCSFEYNGEDTWYLNDLKEQKSTLINAAETYEFVAEPGDTETRFVISATPIHKITTGNESVGAEAAKVRKLIIDDKVYIIRGGRMYSVDGQMIK